jgi:hypothetical protein
VVPAGALHQLVQAALGWRGEQVRAWFAGGAFDEIAFDAL